MKYFGIADAHGIESFIKGDPASEGNSQQAMILHLRAGANRQRHAIVYVVDIPEEVAEEIDDLIINGKYIDALNHLKGSVKDLQLSKLPGAEKSWGMIPNPDLDPYH